MTLECGALLRFKYVENEGAYHFIQKASGWQEDLIQKTLKTQIENSFLKNGFHQYNIIRESQNLDNKRLDFTVGYGFLKPVMVEVKRLDNAEITNKKKRTEYKNKLVDNYMKGNCIEYGIYVVFRINKKHQLDQYIPELEVLYKDENVKIIGIDCVKSQP